MGNFEAKAVPEEIIHNIEKNTLISWSIMVTKKWFECQFIIAQKQLQPKREKSRTKLIQFYMDTLCTKCGIDGYGISLMNQSFFTKLSSIIIGKESKRIPDISTETINNVKSMIDTLFHQHIIPLQTQYNELYPEQKPVLQQEPNMHNMLKMIASDNKQYQLLKWYHYQTEHRVGSSSRTVNRMWFLQPSTCKRYYGFMSLLPLNRFETVTDLQTSSAADPLSDTLLFSTDNKSKKLSLNSISCFIWYSLTLSSSREPLQNLSMPKAAFSKRVNASSGGLHPAECYFLLPSNICNAHNNAECDTHKWLFCHYPVREHALEILGSFDTNTKDEKKKEECHNNIFYVLISAVDYREVWKYGERGLRYSMLDVGHALSALCVAANLMGWRSQIAANVSFKTLQSKFNLPPADHPRILLKMRCNFAEASNDINILSDACILRKKQYITEHYEELGATWPILEAIEKHCLLESHEIQQEDIKHNDEDASNEQWRDCNIYLDLKQNSMDYDVSANYALRHRRSALEFVLHKGSFSMFKKACFIMQNINFPFKYVCCYILYVIRVEDIEPGLYLLFPRHSTKYEDIYKTKYAQREVVDLEILKLYQIEAKSESEIAKMSKRVSCDQSLCSNACFTIDFCVDLNIALQNGHKYSASHWECGFIGQILYNHMESVSLAATAIGCYLDDLASSNAGFDKEPFNNIRSLCHFSCGKPSEDLRYPYYAWKRDLYAADP